MLSGSIYKNLATILALSLLINGFLVLAFYLSVAPIGTDVFVSVAMLAPLPLLGALLFIPVALVLLFWRRYRTMALTLLVGSMIYLVIGFGGLNLSFQVRHDGFISLAQRSRPLVGAIEFFEEKYGRPPALLNELVPEFLAAVPGTGIGASPIYEYSVVTDTSLYEGNPWILKVNTSSGIMNWDTFLYFPKQNYPLGGYGGALERIEDWAYVHE